MDSFKKQFIELALQAKVLKFGEFTLKSGRKSPYFFNAGLFYEGEQLAQLGYYYAAKLQQSKITFDGLFGPAYKGIPLVCATAMQLAAAFEQNKPYTFNRKEAKDHGEGGNFVGAPLKGDIIIVDDVITAGTAFRDSVELIRGQGARVAGVIIALNRQERGQGKISTIAEIEKNHQIPVLSIINLDDLVDYMKKSKNTAAYLPAIEAYREEYGAE